MEWKAWPSVPLDQRDQLPNQAGIYVVVDSEEQVWYVGQSVNINARWRKKGHHRYRQLSRTNNKREYKIHWQSFASSELDQKEQFYIDQFRPHLNYSRVRKYPKRAIQPEQEISRLLKVINNKTILFPNVRSLVFGYYKEIDENDGGNLEEYTCMVIGVTVNDHDRTILKSVNKSLSKKGKSINGCWKVFESPFVNQVSNTRPARIVCFLVDNLVYEFICFHDLPEVFDGGKFPLVNVKLSGQWVLALRDGHLPSELFEGEGYSTDSHKTYLRNRAPDLRSVMDLI